MLIWHDMAIKTEPEQYLVDKKRELIYALHKQGYNSRQLAYLFGVSRSFAHNIVQEIPANWESPWKKVK